MIPFGVWVSSCSLSVACNDCPPPPIRHSGSRHHSLASIQSQDFLMTWSVSTPIRNHHWCALNSGFAPGSSTSIVSEVYVKIKLFSPSHFIETNNRISLFFRTILKSFIMATPPFPQAFRTSPRWHSPHIIFRRRIVHGHPPSI